MGTTRCFQYLCTFLIALVFLARAQASCPSILTYEDGSSLKKDQIFYYKNGQVIASGMDGSSLAYYSNGTKLIEDENLHYPDGAELGRSLLGDGLLYPDGTVMQNAGTPFWRYSNGVKLNYPVSRSPATYDFKYKSGRYARHFDGRYVRLYDENGNEASEDKFFSVSDRVGEYGALRARFSKFGHFIGLDLHDLDDLDGVSTSIAALEAGFNFYGPKAKIEISTGRDREVVELILDPNKLYIECTLRNRVSTPLPDNDGAPTPHACRFSTSHSEGARRNCQQWPSRKYAEDYCEMVCKIDQNGRASGYDCEVSTRRCVCRGGLCS